MRLLVSKQGQPITAGVSQMIFQSDLATHMLQSIVSVSMTGATFTITHNLGFAPKVWIMAYDSVNNLYFRVPYLDFFGQNIDYYITTSQVIIEANGYTSPLVLKVLIFTRSFKP